MVRMVIDRVLIPRYRLRKQVYIPQTNLWPSLSRKWPALYTDSGSHSFPPPSRWCPGVASANGIALHVRLPSFRRPACLFAVAPLPVADGLAVPNDPTRRLHARLPVCASHCPRARLFASLRPIGHPGRRRVGAPVTHGQKTRAFDPQKEASTLTTNF